MREWSEVDWSSTEQSGEDHRSHRYGIYGSTECDPSFIVSL